MWEDVIDAIGNVKPEIFSALDFRMGFHQIPLDDYSKERCSFVTETGTYSYRRLPFGVKSGTVAFQAMITSLFRDVVFKYMICYVDDLVLFSHSPDEHLKHLSEVFSVLREANLKLHPQKCQFASNSVRYLSHIITPQGCKPCPSRIAAVTSFKMPENQKQLRRWLGMTAYWKKFIWQYAKICQPLYRLLRRNVKWNWTNECTEAFMTLRENLTTAPLLAAPDFNKTFYVTTDASGQAIAFYLSQFDDENKEHVICYGGRSLRDAERVCTIRQSRKG